MLILSWDSDLPYSLPIVFELYTLITDFVAISYSKPLRSCDACSVGHIICLVTRESTPGSACRRCLEVGKDCVWGTEALPCHSCKGKHYSCDKQLPTCAPCREKGLQCQPRNKRRNMGGLAPSNSFVKACTKRKFEEESRATDVSPTTSEAIAQGPIIYPSKASATSGDEDPAIEGIDIETLLI